MSTSHPISGEMPAPPAALAGQSVFLRVTRVWERASDQLHATCMLVDTDDPHTAWLLGVLAAGHAGDVWSHQLILPLDVLETGGPAGTVLHAGDANEENTSLDPDLTVGIWLPAGHPATQSLARTGVLMLMRDDEHGYGGIALTPGRLAEALAHATALTGGHP